MAKAKKKKDSGYRAVVSGAKSVLRILIYICVAVAIVFLGREAYTLGYEVFDETPVDKTDGKDVTIVITDDMSVMDIGELLKEEGLIHVRPLAFWIQEFLSEYHNQLLPGAYILNTFQTVEEMLPILAQENTEGQPSTLNQDSSGSSSENRGSAEGGTKP